MAAQRWNSSVQLPTADNPLLDEQHDEHHLDEQHDEQHLLDEHQHHEHHLLDQEQHLDEQHHHEDRLDDQNDEDRLGVNLELGENSDSSKLYLDPCIPV